MQPFRRMLTRLSAHVLLTFAAFALAFASPSAADAAFRGCRTDPIIVLSNGIVLQADVTYETTPFNVVGVNYLVHLPVGGASVTAVIKDPLMGHLEKVNFVYDQPANRYVIDTEVFVTPAAIGTQYEATSRMVFGNKTFEQKLVTKTFKTTSSGLFSHKFFG